MSGYCSACNCKAALVCREVNTGAVICIQNRIICYGDVHIAAANSAVCQKGIPCGTVDCYISGDVHNRIVVCIISIDSYAAVAAVVLFCSIICLNKAAANANATSVKIDIQSEILRCFFFVVVCSVCEQSTVCHCEFRAFSVRCVE